MLHIGGYGRRTADAKNIDSFRSEQRLSGSFHVPDIEIVPRQCDGIRRGAEHLRDRILHGIRLRDLFPSIRYGSALPLDERHLQRLVS